MDTKELQKNLYNMFWLKKVRSLSQVAEHYTAPELDEKVM